MQKSEHENYETYQNKFGEFRAIPKENSKLYSIEKKYWSLGSDDWIEFGVMKLSEFKEFIKANK